MKRYRVTGPTAFQGYEPDTEFDDVLPEDLEARAIARGSIEVVEGKKGPSEKPVAKTGATAKEADKDEGKKQPPSKSGLFAGRDKAKEGE